MAVKPGLTVEKTAAMEFESGTAEMVTQANTAGQTSVAVKILGLR